MKVYGIWYGGYNYAIGSIEDSLEQFNSVQAAADALRSREAMGHGFKQEFNYVHKPADRCYTPCVGQESEMHIFFAEPSPVDAYPDRIIKFGPRGGVRVEYA